MSDAPTRAVLDCMVFAQAIINPKGPAGECLDRSSKGEFKIVLSPYVIGEILELPTKLPPKFAVTAEKVAAFLDELIPTAILIDVVPHVFDHPIDPDDSPYVDLAVAARAALIVSRDRHLLGLTDPRKPWSEEFRRKFSRIRILPVVEFLAVLRQVRGEG